MRICLFIFAASFYMLSFGQYVNYFKVDMGPKFESYKVTGNDNVQSLFHLDASASFYVGKRIKQNVYAEVGLIKNDYSSKIEITTKNTEGEELKSFGDNLYPTFSSVQLALLGGYRHRFSEKWEGYVQGGVRVFVNKKLTREGSQEFIEEAKNESSGYVENISIITYSNGFESGNFLVTTQLGFSRNVSNNMAVDMNLGFRTSTLPINQYSIEYKSFSEQEVKSVHLTTQGAGSSLNIGLRYTIHKFSKK